MNRLFLLRYMCLISVYAETDWGMVSAHQSKDKDTKHVQLFDSILTPYSNIRVSVAISVVESHLLITAAFLMLC